MFLYKFFEDSRKNININKVVISRYFYSYFNTLNDNSHKLYDVFVYKYFQLINKSKITLVKSFKIIQLLMILKLYLKNYKQINFYFILDNPRSYIFDPNVHLEYKFDPNSEYFTAIFTIF